MSQGDVHTRRVQRQWETTIEGRVDLRWVFDTEREALSYGDEIATTLRTRHVVERRSRHNFSPDVPRYVNGT